jgi:DNA polymerase V
MILSLLEKDFLQDIVQDPHELWELYSFVRTHHRQSPEPEVKHIGRNLNYSIDEAFLNLQGMDTRQFGSLAGGIRQTVKQWTGIPVSVGIGPTKTLAKAANRMAKKDPAAKGYCCITGDAERLETLARLPVADIWGIGPAWAKRLEASGIATALQFSQQPDGWIRKEMNVVALKTAMELRGTPCIPLELTPPPRKGLAVSRMFGKKLADIEPISEALAAYVTRAAEKLRRDKMHARHMQIFLQNSPFTKTEPYYARSIAVSLPYATSDTAELIHHATAALRTIYRPGPQYIRCGVMLTELTTQFVRQGDLFDTRNRERSRKLMTALDAINQRHGRDTIFYSASGIRRDWKAYATMKTQHFTTDWRQMLQIRV